MSPYSDLLFEVSDHVATITLNRPDRMNAISGPMLQSFSRAFRDARLQRIGAGTDQIMNEVIAKRLGIRAGD